MLSTELQAWLDEAVARHGLPGASVAALVDDEILAAASGVASDRTKVPFTPDTPFLIGSITKVWTTTLVMSLVDEGLVSLDAPVRTYLPDFTLADEALADEVTVRHLLNHTSGIDGGDYLVDYGRGDESVAKYVAGCAELGRLSDPGQIWSYNNAGFVIAGRVVEVVLGQAWREVLHERLAEPLKLEHAVTTPEDAIVHGAAVGHFDVNGTRHVTPTWMYPPSMAPAGSTLAMTASDLMRFARMHMNEGRAPDGKAVISPASTAAMQAHEGDLPLTSVNSASFGLGWGRNRVFGNLLGLSHSGGSPGGHDTIYVFPERNVAFIAFVNRDSPAFDAEAAAWLGETLLGEKPKAQQWGGPPADLDLSLLEGSYERRFYRLDLEADGDGLRVTGETRMGFAPFTVMPVPEHRLRPLDSWAFALEAPGQPAPTVATHTFHEFDDKGRPLFLHTFGRASRRVTA